MISVRGPKFLYFVAALTAIGTILGVYITFFESRGFVKTSATIVDVVESEFNETDDDIRYYPIVEYSVDGVSYSGKSDRSCSVDSIGKTVTIFYNPENPEVFHGSKSIGIYLIIVCGAIFVLTVVALIRNSRSVKETKELHEENGQTGYAASIRGEERELYFLTDLGTAKAGHHIEDANRKVLYEAKMTKFSMVGDFSFDFIDHEHGTTISHQVGHAEASEYGSALFDDHMTFDFDGEDVWKHLKKSGISAETAYTTGESTVVGMKYRILRDGEEIAMAQTTSQFPHEDDASEHKMASAIPIDGFFRIWSKEQNLDLVFLTLMAFTRSKASDDRGGTIGAKIGTLKNLMNDK